MNQKDSIRLKHISNWIILSILKGTIVNTIYNYLKVYRFLLIVDLKSEIIKRFFD